MRGNRNNLRDGLLTSASAAWIAIYLLGGGDRALFYISIVLLLLISGQRLQLWRNDHHPVQR